MSSFRRCVATRSRLPGRTERLWKSISISGLTATWTTGVPPLDGTRYTLSRQTEKTRPPSRSHCRSMVRPDPGTLQMMKTGPPVAGMLRIVPSAPKAIVWPSGDHAR